MAAGAAARCEVRGAVPNARELESVGGLTSIRCRSSIRFACHSALSSGATCGLPHGAIANTASEWGCGGGVEYRAANSGGCGGG
eukprot:5673937-Prymnesium_polylepis.1